MAQLVAVLASPILTRVYGPDDMGSWGLFVSFLGLASVLTSLRYEVAIVAARKDEDALLLCCSGLVLVLLTSLLGAFAFEFLRQGGALGYGVFSPLATLLAFIALASTGFGLVLRFFALRRERFGVIGRFTVAQAWSKVLLQLVLSPFGSMGLLLGETLGRLVSLGWLFRGLSCLRPAFAPRVLLAYWTYPVIQLPSSFVNTLVLVAPVPLFVSLYGPSAGGALALAQRVVGLPVSLIGTAVADVFYGRASIMLRQEPKRLLAFFLRVSFGLGLMGFALGFVLWFFAPKVATWVFGPEWELAGQMLGAMAPWVTLQLAVSPVSRVVFLSPWSWLKLLYDFLSLGAVLSPLWFLRFSGPVEAVWGISLLMAGTYGAYFVILLFLVHRLQYEGGGGA